MSKVVAVIGASRDRHKFGNRAVRAFRQQGYTVVPINPHEADVEGLKAFASVLDVPGPIDMASLYVPPEVGERVIELTFDVEWLWIAFSAATTAAGPSVQPQRHPVIAYAFDADPQITARSRQCLPSTAGRLCGTGS